MGRFGRVLGAGAPLAGRGGLADASQAVPAGDAYRDGLGAAGEGRRGRGGSIQPREGRDERRLSSYQCVIGKAR
jgi:hypothetical protein